MLYLDCFAILRTERAAKIYLPRVFPNHPRITIPNFMHHAHGKSASITLSHLHPSLPSLARDSQRSTPAPPLSAQTDPGNLRKTRHTHPTRRLSTSRAAEALVQATGAGSWGWTRLKQFVRSGLGGRAVVPLGYQGICRLSRVWDVALWRVWRSLGGWLLYRDGCATCIAVYSR